MTIRGNSIEVDMDREESRYTLAGGGGIELSHDGRRFRLSPDEPTFSTRTQKTVSADSDDGIRT